MPMSRFEPAGSVMDLKFIFHFMLFSNKINKILILCLNVNGVFCYLCLKMNILKNKRGGGGGIFVPLYV